MKKILLFITIFFISSIGVYAEEFKEIKDPLQCFNIAPQSSTKNLFKKDWGSTEKACIYASNSFYSYTELNPSSKNYYCNTNFIEVKPNTNYTFTLFNSSLTPIQSFNNDYIYLFDENFSKVLNKQSFFSPPYNFTTTETSKYFLFCSYTTYSVVNKNYATSNFQLEESKITSSSDLSFVEYLESSGNTEEDDPVIIPDATLDNFYTIYIEKLSSISNFATENKFVLSAIVIILVLVCLELFLYLCKGGRH